MSGTFDTLEMPRDWEKPLNRQGRLAFRLCEGLPEERLLDVTPGNWVLYGPHGMEESEGPFLAEKESEGVYHPLTGGYIDPSRGFNGVNEYGDPNHVPYRTRVWHDKAHQETSDMLCPVCKARKAGRAI